MNLTEAILALGNAKNGQAAELWATGINAFVYKKRGVKFGFPFVRMEVDQKRDHLNRDAIVIFQVLDDTGDVNPTRVDGILEQIGRLFQNAILVVDRMSFDGMWETDRRTEGREGIWVPEIEFKVGMTKA